MSSFNCRRTAPMNVLTLICNRHLVQLSGGRNLSEEYFDAIKNTNCHDFSFYYDIMLCGGEPYSDWI